MSSNERIIQVKFCLLCPYHTIRWHSKEPTHYCIVRGEDAPHGNFGEELELPNMIPLNCPLEDSCKGLAKDLDDALRAGAENVRDYQAQLAEAKKENAQLNQENIDFSKRNAELEKQIEAVNGLIIKFQKEHPYVAMASIKLCNELKAVLFPRKEAKKCKCGTSLEDGECPNNGENV